MFHVKHFFHFQSGKPKNALPDSLPDSIVSRETFFSGKYSMFWVKK
jgi:hypothetical protein